MRPEAKELLDNLWFKDLKTLKIPVFWQGMVSVSESVNFKLVA
jgi:hypothetical protein